MSGPVWKCPSCGQDDRSRAGECWDCGQKTGPFDPAAEKFLTNGEAESLLAREAVEAEMEAWRAKLSGAVHRVRGRRHMEREAAVLLGVLVLGLLLAGPSVRVLRDYSFMLEVSKALDHGEVFSPAGRCAADLYKAERERRPASPALSRASDLIRDRVLPSADAVLGAYLKGSAPTPDWGALSKTYGFLRDAYPAPGEYGAKYWYCRGQADLGSGRFLEARGDFGESLRALPGWSPSLDGLGRVYMDPKSPLHEEAEAVKLFRRAAQADPANPWPTRNLGEYYAARGDLARAEGFYAKAVAAAPNQPAILRRAGDIAVKLGKADEGLKDYQAAQKCARDSGTVRELSSIIAELVRRQQEEAARPEAEVQTASTGAEGQDASARSTADGSASPATPGVGHTATAGAEGESTTVAGGVRPVQVQASQRPIEDPHSHAGASDTGIGGGNPGSALEPRAVPSGGSPAPSAAAPASPWPSQTRPPRTGAPEGPAPSAVPFSLVLSSALPLRMATARVDGKEVRRSWGPGSRGASCMWVDFEAPGSHTVSITVYPPLSRGVTLEARIALPPKSRPVFLVEIARDGRITMRRQSG